MTHSNPSAPAELTSNMLLTLREAIELTGRDRKTLMTWIGGARYPNAIQDATGRKGWRIPVKDLVDAGHLDPTAVVDVAVTVAGMRESKQVAELRTRIVDLEAALAVQTALAEERHAMVGTLQSVVTALVPAAVTR